MPPTVYDLYSVQAHASLFFFFFPKGKKTSDMGIKLYFNPFLKIQFCHFIVNLSNLNKQII